LWTAATADAAECDRNGKRREAREYIAKPSNAASGHHLSESVRRTSRVPADLIDRVDRRGNAQHLRADAPPGNVEIPSL
jgi:hypothetical protein